MLSSAATTTDRGHIHLEGDHYSGSARRVDTSRQAERLIEAISRSAKNIVVSYGPALKYLTVWEPPISREQNAPAWRVVDDPMDASARYWQQVKIAIKRQDLAQAAVNSRLSQLKMAAAEEGVIWSTESEEFLRQFLRQFRPTERPGIVLPDSGELSATWRGARGEAVTLQFKRSGEIGYVMLGAVTPDAAARYRSAGVAPRQEVLTAHLRAVGLLGVVTA